MGLEYRGSRVSDSKDIIRLLDAKAKVAEITSPDDAQAVVNNRVAPLASKSYVDSAFANYATQADVDTAFAGKVLTSALGKSLLQLDSNGKIPASTLPELTTRGAKWVPGGAITPRLDITTGSFGATLQLSSVTVSGTSLMGGRPYYVMGFAQIECKGNFGDSNPVIYIGTSLTPAGAVATGHGIPGWIDYYHITAIPTSTSSASIYTGNRTFYLSCKSFGTSSDFTSFYPTWGLLVVPIAQMAG